MKLLLLVIWLILLGGCVAQEPPSPTETPQPIQEANQTPLPSPEPQVEDIPVYGDPWNPVLITFQVTVPENTPAEDEIFLVVDGYMPTVKGDLLRGAPMQQKENVWTAMFAAPRGSVMSYRYNRNNAEDTDELLGDDENAWRTLAVKENMVVRDSVERWRWFPGAGEPIPNTSSLEPSGGFQARINNIEFRSGQILPDLYKPPMYMFFNSTAERLRNLGYRWVIIMPPWQWMEDDPLPVVGNMLELGVEYQPNYPNDEVLIEHIRAFKNAGLKVHLAPLICCTEISREGRSTEWWEAYLSEVERFLVHHARVAEAGGADSFLFEVYDADSRVATDGRVREMLSKVRREFSGEVGSSVDIWMDENNVPDGIIHEADFFTWGGELDFFVVNIDAPLSFKDSPTDEELKAGAGKLLDYTKPLYSKHGKPVVARGTYFSGEQSWKGAEKYGMPHEIVAPVYGGEDQARVVQAYFEAIRERPWVTGFFLFGYEYEERPLAVEWSARGKPAEDLWRRWNEVIYQD